MVLLSFLFVQTLILKTYVFETLIVNVKQLIKLINKREKFFLIPFDGDQAAQLVNTGVSAFFRHQMT